MGWLSRDDLLTRVGHAGPPYPTPEAQCLGHHRFEYAVYTYRSPWFESDLLRVAQEFTLPPRAFFTMGSFRGPHSLLALEPPQLLLSSLKPAENGEGLAVRIYNPTPKDLVGKIRFGWPVKNIWEARLDEKPVRERPPQELTELTLLFRPGDIKTLLLTLSRRPQVRARNNAEGKGRS